MGIDWGSLLRVLVVSFGSAVAVVVLVSLALVTLPARRVSVDGEDPGQRASGSGVGGTAAGGICLTAAAAIVLYGLYIIVAA